MVPPPPAAGAPDARLPPATSPRVQVERDGPCGARLLTLRALAAGERVTRLGEEGGFVEAPRATRYSIQLGERRHPVPRGALAFLNHSCAPNCVVDTEGLALVALRVIDAGQELTIFYPATEWDMAEPFACRCGAHECLGTINGAKYLDAKALRRHTLSAHVRRLAAAAGVGPLPGTTPR